MMVLGDNTDAGGGEHDSNNSEPTSTNIAITDGGNRSSKGNGRQAAPACGEGDGG